MDWYSVLAVLVFTAAALVFSLRQGRSGLRRTLLSAVLVISALGIWAAQEHRPSLAASLLIGAAIAAVLISLFVQAGTAEDPLVPSKSRMGRMEWALVIGLVIGAGLLRFPGLDRVPNFIHGEENIWTWTVATRLFSSHREWPIGWYFSGVPTSYFQEWPFIRLFGLNYISARYEVAFFGTLAVGLFYLLARTIVERRVALFSTVLLATSTIALASSRGAFVQSHVLFWTVLTYYLYVQAVEHRKALLFLLAGGALAMGSLTYQTFITAIAVVGLHFAYEAVRNIKRWREHVVNVTLLASPVLLVWPRVHAYLQSQQGHVATAQTSLSEIGPSPFEAPGTYVEAIWRNLKQMLNVIFYRQTWDDYIIIRKDGPIFLAGVTALAIVGIALMLPRMRQRWPLFLLVWFFLQLLFSPIILGMPIVRAMLPAFPALFLFAGIGLFAALPNFREMRPRFLGHGYATAVLGLTAVFATTGSLAYFTQIDATGEGKVRQAFVDTIDQYAGKDILLVFPYRPMTNDLFDAERYSIRFAMAGKTGGFDNADRFYAIIPDDQLLTTLRSAGGIRRALVVLQDRDAPPQATAVREEVVQALGSCYSSLNIGGKSFSSSDLSLISSGVDFWPTDSSNERGPFLLVVVENPSSGICNVNAQLTAVGVSETEPRTFQWAASPDSGPFELEIQRERDGVDAHEMEEFKPNGGWGDEAKNAAGFSGTGYLQDPPNAGTMTLSLHIAQPGSYTLWFRRYRRSDSDGTHRMVSIDGKMLGEIATPGKVVLNKWEWEAFGPVDLQAGAHNLEFSHQGGGPALFIDSMYVSTDSTFNPNNDELFTTVMEVPAEQQAGQMQSLTLSEALPPGRYRWQVVSSNALVVDGLGRPIKSDWKEFTVSP